MREVEAFQLCQGSQVRVHSSHQHNIHETLKNHDTVAVGEHCLLLLSRGISLPKSSGLE